MKVFNYSIGTTRESLNNTDCVLQSPCPTYFIPVTDSIMELLNFQLRLLKQAKKIIVKFVDLCTFEESDTTFLTYNIGTDSMGSWFSNQFGAKVSPFEKFCFQFDVTYSDNSQERFFSQDFIKETCIDVSMVEACYSSTDNSGYDSDGLYIGKPVTTYLGNNNLRYYHNYPIRGGIVASQGTKITYTTLNHKNNVKAVSERTYSLKFEVIPSWYNDEFAKAFEKGVISLNGTKYLITSFDPQVVGDPCCSRIFNTIISTVTNTTRMSCASEVCVFPTCTDPTLSNDIILGCFDYSTNWTFTIGGTHPVAFKVISNTTNGSIFPTGVQDGGTWIDVSSFKVVNPLTHPSSIVIELENCNGKFTKTINFDSKCCDIGTPSFTEVVKDCSIGIPSYQLISYTTYTATKTQSFTKNNCPAGQYGSIVSFTKEYTSTVSQADADLQMTNDTNYSTEGQAYANTNGTCSTTVTYYAPRTGNFTKNNCTVNGVGSTTSFSKTYSSTVSQADADLIATNNFNADGQAYVNLNGTCTYSVFRYGWAVKSDCQAGYVGSNEYFEKTYTSVLSYQDALDLANANWNTDLQNNANVYGTCSPNPTFYMAVRSGSFTRNDCQVGCTGSAVDYNNIPYYSNVSQADAEAIADAQFPIDGQDYANGHGTCDCGTTTYSAFRGADFTKNDCSTGGVGSVVYFSKTYYSTVSQADADAIANASFNTEGQAYANVHGSCLYTVSRTSSFTKNDCAVNYSGNTISYTNEYSSLVSLADANNIADTNFNADGQAYANTNAGCTYTPTTFSKAVSGPFTRNDCPAGCTGNTVIFYTTYYSNISQADADAQASANFNTDGQAFANSSAGCSCNYTAYRSGNFTRNNCGSGYSGSTVAFSKTYTSTVSQADADAIANNSFSTDGQAYANLNGTCTLQVACYLYQVHNESEDPCTYSWNHCTTGEALGEQIAGGAYAQICARENSVYNSCGTVTLIEPC